jgi:phosphomethylpyrimidine synthase
MQTQLELARQGQLTDLVSRTAENEGVDAAMLRDELAAGRAVIPANTIHVQHGLKPCAIGRCVSTKINANIGLSSVRSSLDDEIEKMRGRWNRGRMRLWISVRAGRGGGWMKSAAGC